MIVKRFLEVLHKSDCNLIGIVVPIGEDVKETKCELYSQVNLTLMEDRVIAAREVIFYSKIKRLLGFRDGEKMVSIHF